MLSQGNVFCPFGILLGKIRKNNSLLPCYYFYQFVKIGLSHVSFPFPIHLLVPFTISKMASENQNLISVILTAL